MPRDDEHRKPFDNVVRSVFLSSMPKVTLEELDQIIDDLPFDIREALCDIPCFPVNSSLLEHIGYHPKQEVLELHFKNSSSAFRYREFPQERWDDFVSTESFGSYFHKHIKDEYEFMEVRNMELHKVTTNEI